MRKMVVLAIVAVLALTSVGFGFAKWSSSVDANVSVNTGNVQIGIRDVGTNDDTLANLAVNDDAVVGIGDRKGLLGADPQWSPYGLNTEAKDVAKLTSVNLPSTPCDPIGNTGFFNRITESITNGYPWYAPTTEVQIKNLGSIPVKLEALTWKFETGDNLDPWIDVVSYTITMPDGSPLPAGTAATGSGRANFEEAIKGIQLHAGDVMTVDVQLGLRELKAGTTDESVAANVLPQNATGAFSYHVTASQWNEVQ